MRRDERDSLIKDNARLQIKLLALALRHAKLQGVTITEDARRTIEELKTLLQRLADSGDETLIDSPLMKRLREKVERDGTLKNLKF